MGRESLKVTVSRLLALFWHLNAALSDPQKRKARNKALTIVELIIVMAIIGTLFGMGIPMYQNQIEKARITAAIAEIYRITEDLEGFFIEWGSYPETLSAVGRERRKDPWGNLYQYLRIEMWEEGKVTGKAAGEMRKDRFLVPLNKDFDLYSKGKDGKSLPPLTAKESWDDVVRANNGAYIGLGKEY